MMNKQLIYIVSTLLLFSACAEKEEISTPAPIHTLEITAEDFQSALVPATRMTEDGYKTTFSDGDQIGITALIGDKIADGMDNKCYVYAAATGKWTPAVAGTSLFFYDNVSYIAYYPYQAGMNGQKTLDGIVAAFSPQVNQTNYQTGYSASCLMTATGTADLSSKKLSFNFAHAMTMLELQFIKGSEAVTVTTGSTLQATSGGKVYTFNEQSAAKRYRLFLKPSSSFDLNLSFAIDGTNYSYVKPGLTAPVAGKYLHYDLKVTNVVILSTGAYEGTLGEVSTIRIGRNSYMVKKQTNSTYKIVGLNAAAGVTGEMSIYINDKEAKSGSAEQLLLTTNKATFNSATETITVNLSAGGMEGEGTEADPYLVTTPPQLRGVGVKGTNDNSAETECYRQTGNLDLSIYADWKPVKSGLLYDGNGFKINNLKSTQGGIFSYSGGTIQNVHLVSGEITVNNKRIGGIVNISDRSGCKILKCSNAATIISTNGGDVGGIVGSGGHSIIEYCKNSGNITVDIYGGGIAGLTWGNHLDLGDANMDTEIRYCYNVGNITKTNASNSSGDCGGIVARLVRTKIVEYCYNAGVMTDNGGNNRIGSLTGELDHSYSKNNYGISIASGKLHYSNNGGNSTDDRTFSSGLVWPTYSTDPSNGWGSAYWKSYIQGGFPELLWE